MTVRFLLPILLITIILVSGCSQQSNEKIVKEFKVKISHSGYLFYLNNRPVLNPSVNIGDIVRFLATSQTAEENHSHGITIEEYKINNVATTANEKEPVVIEFIADKPGKFRVWCKTCEEGIFGSEHPEIEAVLEVG